MDHPPELREVDAQGSRNPVWFIFSLIFKDDPIPPPDLKSFENM